MKKFFLALSALTLLFSTSAFALNKVTITGTPVPLTMQNGTYVLADPNTVVTPTLGYYYFTINNVNKVCYLTEQTGLSKLNSMTVTANIGGGTTQKLFCYAADPQYFVIKQ